MSEIGMIVWREAYAIEEGDRFNYCGRRFKAVADATGEFNTYVRAFAEDTQQVTEVYIPHGGRVRLL